MFSPVRMARLEALLPKSAAGPALAALEASGEAELAPAEPGSAAGKVPQALAEPAARLAALRRSLALPEQAGPVRGMEEGEALAALERWESRAGEPLARRKVLAAALAAASAENGKLGPYAGLAFPCGGKPGGRALRCSAGYVPAENAAALRRCLPAGALLALLGEEKGLRRLAVLAGPAELAGTESALKNCGFRAEELPGDPGLTLGGLAARAAGKEEKAAAELAAAEKELAALAAAAAGELASAGAALERAAALAAAKGSLGGTASVSLISAWVPAASAEKLAGELAASAGGACAAEVSPPRRDDDVPVLLRPPRLLRPFAALVSAYGLPRYGEVEPTAFAAAAFLLMFGMMFGDAGQGAVVAAAGLWLSRSADAQKRTAGRVLTACGLSAAGFGLVYGSFFGLESFRRFALWRDPLAGDPLAPVLAAAGFGAAVISLGVVLNAVNLARRGDKAGALLGRFGAAGLLFYWSGLAWAAGLAGPGLALPLMGLAAAGWVLKDPALWLLEKGRGAPGGEGFAEVSAEAAVGAFEAALLYLANTVSFVRLAAYAFSHAALTAAAYALRDAADRSLGAGSAAGVLAVVLGNAAAIGLEGLVAGVQALRLEYYEFFGKFLEGAGRPFRPLVLVRKGET